MLIFKERIPQIIITRLLGHAVLTSANIRARDDELLSLFGGKQPVQGAPKRRLKDKKIYEPPTIYFLDERNYTEYVHLLIHTVHNCTCDLTIMLLMRSFGIVINTIYILHNRYAEENTLTILK